MEDRVRAIIEQLRAEVKRLKERVELLERCDIWGRYLGYGDIWGGYLGYLILISGDGYLGRISGDMISGDALHISCHIFIGKKLKY
jgi:hypothetical protein